MTTPDGPDRHHQLGIYTTLVLIACLFRVDGRVTHQGSGPKALDRLDRRTGHVVATWP